ncbi:MAG: sugar ABC transporter ATP-binding protein, partial [Hyphomicrobiales bacterium]|nr:sugar ABC transporter ATP-binding protein [Hyphomicrobiales bacterium]
MVVSGVTAEPAASSHPPLLSLEGVSKQFPGVKALDNVSMSIWPGEVHMLLGENGAGKSSLIKILCGAYHRDTGSMSLDGQPLDINSPLDAARVGIAVIFQEYSLVPFLDIAQNIFLGREPQLLMGVINGPRLYAEAEAILKRIGFDIDPRTKIHTLGIAQQQMVEIAKAVSQDARILIMDEPTAALSDRETAQLFKLIRDLKARGVAIVYISHRLKEVFELGDRITILRDGRNAGYAIPAETSIGQLVNAMVGREVDLTYPRTFTTPGEVVLRLEGVSSPNGVKDVSLEVRRGEIVGLAGLVGSGRTEVARAIFGIDSISAGKVSISGKLKRGGVSQVVKLGVGLIPESRKVEGLALSRTVRDNLTAAGLQKLFPSGLFRPEKAKAAARRLIERLRIATPSSEYTAGLLSGGNQQKIVIGKWLLTEPRLYIFDEPTRGIDVGSKAQIFAEIDRLVAEVSAVLMISSE